MCQEIGKAQGAENYQVAQAPGPDPWGVYGAGSEIGQCPSANLRWRRGGAGGPSQVEGAGPLALGQQQLLLRLEQGLDLLVLGEIHHLGGHPVLATRITTNTN